jgi:SAM-dependent methyltransferase
VSDQRNPSEFQVEADGRAPQLYPPPGQQTVPDFDGGWQRADGGRAPYLSYLEGHQEVNWSADLEQLHVETSRDHFMDVWTRGAILERLGSLPVDGVIVDLGCSTGYLLEELQKLRPRAQLIGVDMIDSGLRTAHQSIPAARLLQADVCALPLADASIDAAVSANLLEHVDDDEAALSELHRVMRPGGRAVLVVPTSPGSYDYYDRFLGHARRYARGELAAKARRAGMELVEDAHLGSLLFPTFWLVKQRNRRLYGRLEGHTLAARVAADIGGTRDSRVGRLACEAERRLLAHGVRLPWGIRGLTVLRRPERQE